MFMSLCTAISLKCIRLPAHNHFSLPSVFVVVYANTGGNIPKINLHLNSVNYFLLKHTTHTHKYTVRYTSTHKYEHTVSVFSRLRAVSYYFSPAVHWSKGQRAKSSVYLGHIVSLSTIYGQEKFTGTFGPKTITMFDRYPGGGTLFLYVSQHQNSSILMIGLILDRSLFLQLLPSCAPSSVGKVTFIMQYRDLK